MELKTKYQYTYFIYPYVIKENRYLKYLLRLLKDKNYVLPQYLLKNYKNIGLNSEELIFLIYLINLEKPIVCDYNIFSEDVNMKVPEILTLINNLKPIELDSFKEGYITELTGYIPMFKMDYELDLISDLQKLGITSVFDESADLSNITNDNAYITDAKHSANIEFSNDGIKAAAATMAGGAGNAIDAHFEYRFDVPVETINLTFDKPFLYLIRDKDTGEVWFAGTVYEPIEFIHND